MIRPSSLPMLDVCSAYESSGGEFADLGTRRHKALQTHFSGDDTLLDQLDEESQDGIRWAAEYIRCNAPMSDHPIEWETTRAFIAPDFSEITGTPDVVCGQMLFDFKWRRRNYDAQMAAYALMLMESGRTDVDVRVLFGESQHAERLKFNRESAEAIVGPIMERAAKPAPTSCQYCGWCAKRLVCSALTGPAKEIAHGYTDGQLGILNWHPSKMESAEEIDTALTVARVVAKWCESVEHHAKDAAIKRGLALPSYELKERKGRQFVADVQRAYELSGMEPAEFLKCCDVRLSTSKTYPDRVGLDTVFATREKLKPTAAKKFVVAKLADVIDRAKPTVALVSKKETETE